MASIDELKKLVASWQKVEDNGGSPTSRGKLLAAKKALAAEVQASVMLGRNVNLQKARELALNGDIEGFQTEILKQVGSQAEFDKMNVLQKKALAEAKAEVKPVKKAKKAKKVKKVEEVVEEIAADEEE